LPAALLRNVYEGRAGAEDDAARLADYARAVAERLSREEPDDLLTRPIPFPMPEARDRSAA
jgi:hypothetical protein